ATQAAQSARAAQEAERAGRRAAAAEAPTVEARCADKHNVITQQLCHARQCLRSEFRNDPICAHYRELEEARRRQGP
ncbi:MAG: hypothetical protein ABI696_09530, partial [Rubrivivax sp.]